MRDFEPAYVGSGSNSAVSGFLRHGCFTPETGHWLARLARPKSATNGHSMGRLEGSVHPPPAEAVLLGRMKRGSSQIMTPLASAEAELQSDRAALLRLRSDRGCGRVGCEQFCSDSGRTKA
jgi:hypothetical protein